jgi:hypothetical protein
MVDFPGYAVGVDGSVWSMRRPPPRRLRAFADPEGYLLVTLRASGRPKTVRVHRLVANAYLPAPAFAPAQVRHLNGNPSDNRAENLAWGTALQNAADRGRHGRTARGTRVPSAKLDSGSVAAILAELARGRSQDSIAREYGVSQSVVSDIKHGVLWREVPR